jgi:hypothetical protein
MTDKLINVPFYISTNNKHLECLRVFVEIFNCFCPNQELRILGYNKPSYTLPKNCNFISMGKQGDVTEWSTDLRRYFINSSEDYFIYGTEDTFFFKEPQINFINYLIEIIKASDSIGRINLVDGTEGDNCSLVNSIHYDVAPVSTFYGNDWSPWKLYRQTRSSDYSLTTQFSIWNKKFFLKYLVDGLSPWDFERQSFKATADEKYSVYMIDESFPISKKEGYSLGTWTNKEFWMPFLSKKTKQEIFEDINHE